jgi:multidrug transporter EmrE-like cation transporter
LRVKDKKNFKDKKNLIPLAMICGVCTFTMNFLNLKLSGLLPSQLFFPLVNGSAIVLSSVMSAVLFKERLSKRQTVGLVGGIICLIAICLVP